MSKLLQQNPRADALEPVYDLAHVLVWTLAEKQVNVVACDFAGHDLQFMLGRNLPQQITHTKSDFAGQDRFSILRHPD